jgi:hypothetical protein
MLQLTGWETMSVAVASEQRDKTFQMEQKKRAVLD